MELKPLMPAIPLTPHQAKYLAYELTRRGPANSIEKFAGTLADAKVDMESPTDRATHRPLPPYGQQHDVVVINFLNRANAADQRVHELLSDKLKLFDGLFGSSDEVLGILESGVDFEKRIHASYQT